MRVFNRISITSNESKERSWSFLGWRFHAAWTNFTWMATQFWRSPFLSFLISTWGRVSSVDQKTRFSPLNAHPVWIIHILKLIINCNHPTRGWAKWVSDVVNGASEAKQGATERVRHVENQMYKWDNESKITSAQIAWSLESKHFLTDQRNFSAWTGRLLLWFSLQYHHATNDSGRHRRNEFGNV